MIAIIVGSCVILTVMILGIGFALVWINQYLEWCFYELQDPNMDIIFYGSCGIIMVVMMSLRPFIEGYVFRGL